MTVAQGDDAGMGRAGRLARISIWIALVAGVVGLPAHLAEMRGNLPLLRLWFEPQAQHRLALGPAYDFLRAADAVLPTNASVLLLTSGSDVRHREYTTFHRALYFLTPRQVWWMSPAPPDGTWESRWWISAPLAADAIRTVARDKRASHILAFELDAAPPVGKKVADLPRGAFYSIESELAEKHAEGRLEPVAVSPFWLPRLIGALLVILLLGHSALVIIDPLSGMRGTGRVALAWTLGAGLTSTAMLWLNAAGASLDQQVAMISTAAVGGFAALRWIRRHDLRSVGAPERGEEVSAADRLLAALLVVLLIAEIALVILSAVGRPLTVWDSWVLWGMRARTIFLESGIGPAVYADPSRSVTLLDYPLLVPTLEAWVYAWLGAPDDRLAGVVTVVSYVALAAVARAALLRRGVDRLWALAAATTLVAIPSIAELAGNVFADVPVALFATVAALHLTEWLEGRGRAALTVGSSSAGFLVWTKKEGAILAACLALATLIAGRASRRAVRGALGIAAAGIVFGAPWYIFVASHGAPHPDFLEVTPENFFAGVNRLPSIAWHALSTVMSPRAGWVWPAALVFAFLCRRDVAPAQPTAILPLTAVIYLSTLSFAYVFSDYAPYQQHVASSFFRLSAHVVALPLLWIACHASAKR